ncbi:MAG TPA: hypothetical protein VMY59_07470 [Candidatus Thermoplasmatota archaeon]|nr:hypothetical protein [Candidatus Thermoplasmatota archaeon]
MKTKQCCRCKIVKELSNFHKSKRTKDGVQTMCKSCNKEYQKVYIRKYRQTKTGKEIANRYCHSDKGLYKSRKAYEKNKTKKIASASVRGKVKRGLIPHPSTLKCSNCTNRAREYHHHKGYAKKNWYDVIPICTICHNKIHNPVTL